MAIARNDKRVRELDLKFRDAIRARGRGKINEAEVALEQLLPEYGTAGAPDRQAMVRINQAQLLQQRGELDRARRTYEEAKLQAETLGDMRRVGLCLGGMASIALESAELDRAETLVHQALKAFRQAEDTVGIGNQLGNLGLLRQGQGRIEEAIDAFNQASVHFVTAGNAAGAVGVLQCIGELHRRQGEFEEADRAHRRALQLAEQAGNLMAQAHSHRAVGQLYRLRGDLEKSLEHIARGHELHKEIGDLRGELASLIDLATVRFNSGDGEGAVTYLSECIERARDVGMITPLTKALLNRALYSLDTEAVEVVSADLDEARTLLERLKDPAALNVWAVTSARVRIRRGDWDEAEQMLNDQLEQSTRANLAPSRPPILGLLASIDLLRGNTQQALTRFDEAESLYRSMGDVDGARMSLTAKGRLLAERGLLDQAGAVFNSLLDSIQTARVVAPVVEAEVYSSRASMHELAGRFELAITDAQRAQKRFREARLKLSYLGSCLLEHSICCKALRGEGRDIPASQERNCLDFVEQARALKSPPVLTSARVTLADTLACVGRTDDAVTLATQTLTESRALGFIDAEARSLEILARCTSDRDVAMQAWQVWNRLESPIRAKRVQDEFELTTAELDSASQVH